MELYNVLLVDDEADVLQAMKKKIDWEALGFCLAGTAENGQEALEMAEQLHIDVVMTDIKMPYMDGLIPGLMISSLPEKRFTWKQRNIF